MTGACLFFVSLVNCKTLNRQNVTLSKYKNAQCGTFILLFKIAQWDMESSATQRMGSLSLFMTCGVEGYSIHRCFRLTATTPAPIT